MTLKSRDDDIIGRFRVASGRSLRESAAVEASLLGQIRSASAANCRYMAPAHLPGALLFGGGDQPRRAGELMSMWWWGVSVAGWLKLVLGLLHTFFTWTAPCLHLWLFTVVAG
jgi:hypothetical protein